MRLKVSMVIGLLSLLFVACSGEGTMEENSSEGIKVDNIKELVNDYSVGNVEGESASITSHELIVRDSEGNETIYALPDDEFFVSIAPYYEQTHP